MTKIILNKPALICLYGFPGSGKSYVARSLTEIMEIAHVSSDRIRSELFARPRYDAQENAIVTHLMDYMSEEFLAAGLSVVYDTNALRSAQRRKLRELARKHKAEYLLIWLQIDIDSAFGRTQNRDRRTTDDKFAEPQTRETFNRQVAGMQNPEGEDYVVISGKHTFATQKSAIINRLYQRGLVVSGAVQHSVAKPGLVNLVPNPRINRVDLSRRDISIS
ncbi:MAG TPA: ATP-binding protein [Candidatus Saccharimonadales bacterium]|nr:ATP-binding protein [Candidatus Saccharimonadales bacterium]